MLLRCLNRQRKHIIEPRWRFSAVKYLSITHDDDLDDLDETTTLKPRGKHSNFKFMDKVKLEVRGGKGGNGCISYDILAPGKKRPNGGSGGRGGNIYLVADKGQTSFSFQTFHFNASDGLHGGSDGLTGRRGKDIYIKVPCGTLVRESSDEEEDNYSLFEDDFDEFDEEDEDEDVKNEDEDEDEDEVEDEDEDEDEDKNMQGEGRNTDDAIDLDEHEDVLLVAEGGKPGIGNGVMAGTAARRTKSMPRTKQPGSEGEHRSLVLELKLIADVGLVGFPNAGKSTLLAALSNAQPRIAPYPFTTLHPNVGVVEYSDTKRLTMADIPGLVEGASDNKGLGHAFLRHIERTKLLLIVVDVSGSENGRPLRQLNALLDELRLYDESILSKPIVIFANKTDISSAFNEALLPASVALGEVSHPSDSVIEKKKRGRPPKTNSLLTAKTNANVKQLDPDAIAHFEQVAMLQELKKKAHALNVVLVSGSAEQGSGLAQLAHVIRVTLERGAI